MMWRIEILNLINSHNAEDMELKHSVNLLSYQIFLMASARL